MFTYLRSLGLSPIEWEHAIAETGMGTPHNLDAVRAAVDVAQVVVVVLTAEDQAGLLPGLGAEEEEVLLQGQPRQNVTLEAGLAMGVAPDRTILVELGPIRHASDFEGLNAVRLTNNPGTRAALRTRLRSAGCAVNDAGADWTSAEAGGDFEGCVVSWQPSAPRPTDQASATRERETRIHSALQRLIGELRYNQRLIRSALAEEVYWDPTRRGLVSAEWHREYEWLAGERDLRGLYAAVESAHQEIDRVNHLVEERERYAPDEDARLPVLPGDELPTTDATVEYARSELEAALAEL